MRAQPGPAAHHMSEVRFSSARGVEAHARTAGGSCYDYSAAERRNRARRAGRKDCGRSAAPGLSFAKGRGPGDWENSSASLSIGFHVEVTETLRRQLPVATAIVKAKCRERLDKAIAAVRDAKISDQALLPYKVDPVAWYSSIEAALFIHSFIHSGGPGTEASAWMPLRYTASTFRDCRQ